MAVFSKGSMVASHSRPPSFNTRAQSDDSAACSLRLALGWQTSPDLPTDAADCVDHVILSLARPIAGVSVNLGGDASWCYLTVSSSRVPWGTSPAQGKNAFLLWISNSDTAVLSAVGPFKVGP